MNEPMFSIIIPVYNAEKYIDECIESILKQKYNNYEVIVIDDGSIDSSLSICKKYEKKDTRIKVFSQKNKGVSATRNRGISLASGKYIIFIDSDDYIRSSMLNELKKNISKEYLLCFGYTKKYKNKEIKYTPNCTVQNDIDKIYELIFFDNRVGGNIANKVFSKDIINKYNLKFDTSIHYCEDLLFIFNYINSCKKIKTINKNYYFYRMRKNSVSFNFINEKNLTILDTYLYLAEYFKNNNKIKFFFEYNYLLNLKKLKSIIKKDNIRKDILSRENTIIKNNNLSFKEKVYYYFVYNHIALWKYLKKIKNVIYKLYD